MHRPPAQPHRETINAEDLEAYDSVVNRFKAWRGVQSGPEEHFEVGAYFGAMLNSPQTCATASKFGTYFRDVGNHPGSFSHADREFVDQVLSFTWKTNVVQQMHIADAVKEGVRIEAIVALRDGRDDLLTEDELLLATYIRQVVEGRVENATYGRMEARMGLKGLVDYTAFILWLQWVIRMMQALDTGTISDERVNEIISGIQQQQQAQQQ